MLLCCEGRESAAAGYLEFTKHRVEMLFYGLQTQTSVIGNLLVAATFTRKLRNLALPACESGESRQTEKSRPAKHGAVAAQIFARDQKMWSSDTSRLDLS